VSLSAITQAYVCVMAAICPCLSVVIIIIIIITTIIVSEVREALNEHFINS